MTRRGFTLLEMLLAVTLLAVVMAAGYALLSTGLSARRTIDRADAEGRSLNLAVDLIARDLAAALPPGGLLAGSFVGDDEPGGDELTLHASLAGNDDPDAEPRGDVARVAFRLETDATGQAMLVREVVRNLLATREVDGEVQPLCRNVADFQLAYHDGAQWLDQWDSTLQANALPQAVRVTLSIRARAPDPTDETAGLDADVDAQTHALTRVVPLPCAPPSEVAP
jgi:general secretion pathway protein J